MSENQTNNNTPAANSQEILSEVFEVHEQEKAKKRKREIAKKLIIAAIWIVCIIGAGFLVLFLASRIAEFDTIKELLAYIGDQFN